MYKLNKEQIERAKDNAPSHNHIGMLGIALWACVFCTIYFHLVQ